MAKVPRKWARGAERHGGSGQWPCGEDSWGSGRVSFLPGVSFRDTQSRRSSRHEHSGDAGLDFIHSWKFLLVSFLREEEASQPDGVENAVSLLQGSRVLESTSSNISLMVPDAKSPRSHHGCGLPCLPGVFGLGAMWLRTGAL